MIERIANGHFRLTYEVIDTSFSNTKCQELNKMHINLLCPKSHIGSKLPILQSNELCEFEIDWYTEHACGIHNTMHVENSCVIHDDNKKVYINLSYLNKPSGK